MLDTSLYILLFPLLIIGLFLILLILIQKGRGGGLASAFGGGGGNTAFGSKTGDVLTWATSIIFGVFLLLSVVLSLLADHQNSAMTSSTPATPAQQTPTTPENPAQK